MVGNHPIHALSTSPYEFVDAGEKDSQELDNALERCERISHNRQGALTHDLADDRRQCPDVLPDEDYLTFEAFWRLTTVTLR
jgi:hypothetical protein